MAEGDERGWWDVPAAGDWTCPERPPSPPRVEQPARSRPHVTLAAVTPEPRWQKSSYCSSTTCVEVAHTDQAVLVRDSKNPDQAPLAFTPAEWDAFVRGAKAGEFG